MWTKRGCSRFGHKQIKGDKRLTKGIYRTDVTGRVNPGCS